MAEQGRTRLHFATRVSATAAVLAALLGGCGGSSDEKSSNGAGDPTPEATVQEFFTAAGNADGEKACSRLSPSFQATFSSDGNCVASVEGLSDEQDDQERFANAQVLDGQTTGDTAEVNVEFDGVMGVYLLMMTDEGWKIDGSQDHAR